MGTDKIKPRHLDEDFKLPLDKLEKMPTANEVGALPNTTKATDIGGASAEVVENLSDEVDTLKKSVSDGKSLVAGAITDKGIITAADATFATMAQNINNIKIGVDTSDATASADAILKDMSAYVNGLKITGTMPNIGSITKTLSANGSYTIPKGFHDGTGKVIQSLPTQTAKIWTPGTTNQTIAAGTYLSGAQTIAGSSNLVASNIKSGVEIFGVTGSLAAVGSSPAPSSYTAQNHIMTTTNTVYGTTLLREEYIGDGEFAREWGGSGVLGTVTFTTIPYYISFAPLVAYLYGQSVGRPAQEMGVGCGSDATFFYTASGQYVNNLGKGPIPIAASNKVRLMFNDVSNSAGYYVHYYTFSVWAYLSTDYKTLYIYGDLSRCMNNAYYMYTKPSSYITAYY